MLTPQIVPTLVPDNLIPPDSKRNFAEYDQDISHTYFYWDLTHKDLGIDLQPIFNIRRAIFVFSRYNEIISIHQLHLIVAPFEIAPSTA